MLKVAERGASCSRGVAFPPVLRPTGLLPNKSDLQDQQLLLACTERERERAKEAMATLLIQTKGPQARKQPATPTSS